ncbi:MAG: hypothetical protein ACO23S_02305 [Candidatus Nanopelagicaceae bacterium]
MGDGSADYDKEKCDERKNLGLWCQTVDDRMPMDIEALTCIVAMMVITFGVRLL